MKTTALSHTLKISAIALFALATTNCTPKGPEVVSAGRLVVPQRTSPTQWAVDSAPRTRPGAIMDPDALTYAQVPSRILYLPGEHGLFGRKSAEQEVAYNLVPVDRVGAIQAQNTPGYENKPADGGRATRSVQMSIPDGDGNIRKGVGRRLGVTGQSRDDKRRAESMLDKKEDLEWHANLGWVGFIESEFIRQEKKDVKVEIPEIEAEKPVQTPELNKPQSTPSSPKVAPKPQDGGWDKGAIESLIID